MTLFLLENDDDSEPGVSNRNTESGLLGVVAKRNSIDVVMDCLENIDDAMLLPGYY